MDESGNSWGSGDVGVFPVRESVNAKITSHSLTKENLIYATDVSITSQFSNSHVNIETNLTLTEWYVFVNMHILH